MQALGLAAPTTAQMQQAQAAAAQQTAALAAAYQAATATPLTTPPTAAGQPLTGTVPAGLGTDCLTPNPPLPDTVQIPASPTTTPTQPATPSVTAAAASSCTTAATSGTQLGVYVGNPNNSDAGEQATTMAAFASFASAVGTPTAMNTYVDQSIPASQWAGNAGWDAASWAATPQLAPGKVTPVVALPMAQPGDSADADFQAIASGAWDADIKGVLQAWASAGYTTIDLRPGWEMNGNWEPWSVTGSNAADYVAAFQHIAALAHSTSGMTVNVVWNPNVGGSGVTTSSMYPGNASVDIIGIDNYGSPITSDSSPQDPGSSTNFTIAQAIAMAKADGKPIALPETGASNAKFPANVASAIAGSGVPVAFVNIWDSNADCAGCALTPQTAAAWKAAFAQNRGLEFRPRRRATRGQAASRPQHRPGSPLCPRRPRRRQPLRPYLRRRPRRADSACPWVPCSRRAARRAGRP